MGTCTDTFDFNKLKMFEVLRDCLPDDKSSTQNILEVKDDILFVWNSKNCCLFSLNWRSYRGKGDAVKYQTLIPSSSQNFIADKILSSTDGTYIAISGQQGVSILQLPRRWGVYGQFQDGKDCIICRIYNLDQRLFLNNTHLEVLQIRWHPSSPTDSHLLVLLSDNTLRVYDEGTLKHVWRIGPIPATPSASGNTLPFLNSLGDTAVDFDIAPPRVVKSNVNNKDYSTAFTDSSLINKNTTNETAKVEWPIIILRGNGHVYILCAGVDTEKPHLEGPVSILPASDDNYGVDSCSIIVVPSLPPTVVIAESTGKLHHALLLEDDNPQNTSFNEIDSTVNLNPSEWTLNVLETVELELGLSENKSSTDYTCPVHLKRDPINEFRYFAYHNTGLHAITMDFVKHLQDFVDEADDENKVPNLTNESRAEYIVCTKALENNKVNPILGFSLLQSPSGMLLLLGSGQLVTLDLITDPSLLHGWPLRPNKDVVSVVSPLKKMFQESFELHIKNILKSGLSQPLLKLDNSSEPTPQESIKLLMHATQTLRDQYFNKHDKARQEIQKRIKILTLLKEQQFKEIEDLQNEKENIRDNAERLAETYEDVCEKQQALLKRAQEVVRLATLRLPKVSASEKEFTTTLEKISLATKILTSKIEQTKLKIQTQQNQIDNVQKDNAEEKIFLPKKQETTIKEVLTDMTTQINTQINDIKKINNILQMV